MGVTYINPYMFGFNPLSLSPQAWYDASDTSTITSSSGAVSQWNDKSGNGRHVTQATAARQPGTGAVTQNGLNVLTFDGGDWLFASTAADWKFLHDGTEYVIAAAVQWGTTANPNASYTLMATYSSSYSQRGFLTLFESVSPQIKRITHGVSNGTSTPSTENVSLDNATTANNFTIYSVYADPDNATAADRSWLYNNGGSAIKRNTRTAAPSTSNPTYPLYIGVLWSGGSFFLPLVGRIAEIIIVSGANATEANRVALRDYLNAKWAVY